MNAAETDIKSHQDLTKVIVTNIKDLIILVPNGLFSKISKMDSDIKLTITDAKNLIITDIQNMKSDINNSLIADFVSTTPGSDSIESTVNFQGSRI